MDDPLARLPQMAAAYNVPAGNTPDFYALQILANVLSSGKARASTSTWSMTSSLLSIPAAAFRSAGDRLYSERGPYPGPA